MIKVSNQDIAKIIAQASTFIERVNARERYIYETGYDDKVAVNNRLERWCKIAANDDLKKFNKRLKWEKLDKETASYFLRDIDVKSEIAFPMWTETLKEIIDNAAEIGGYSNIQKFLLSFSKLTHFCKIIKLPVDLKKPLPFEDILLSAVITARQKLMIKLKTISSDSADYLLQLMSEKAYLAMERDLLHQLISLSIETLEDEFSAYRAYGQHLLTLLKSRNRKENNFLYKSFVMKNLKGGLLCLFQKYPVLGKLIAIKVDSWVDATLEFVKRLKRDLNAIENTFISSDIANLDNEVLAIRLGKIIEIKPSLSDPHNHGRSVLALIFESGVKIVYKPKCLDLCLTYNKFLGWCNSQKDLPLYFKILKVLNCQNYGWVEYVENIPCKDIEEVKRFYTRVGMLTCLLYSFHGTDGHCENLVASGEHFLLIDIETLMQHKASLMENDLNSSNIALEFAGYKEILDSVLNIGLLPHWRPYKEKDKWNAYDYSAIGNTTRQKTSRKVPEWENINTDDMRRVYKSGAIFPKASMPKLNNSNLSPNDYVEEIMFGFRQMYQFLLKKRHFLITDNSFLLSLKNKKVRFVFRSTEIYAKILSNSLSSRCLKSGVERSIELEILSRAFLETTNKPSAWLILQGEIEAIERLDIPYFGALSDSNTLSLGVNQPIKGYFVETCYDRVLKRLQKLNSLDLDYQLALIEESFYSKTVKILDNRQLNSSLPLPKKNTKSCIELMTSEQLVEEASYLAQEIHQRAICRDDLSHDWIVLKPLFDTGYFTPQSLQEGLYEGRCGISIFLAALDYVCDTSQFYEPIVKNLSLIRKVLYLNKPEIISLIARQIGISGSTGLASIAYSLVKISEFTKDLSLLEDAQRAANLISLELIHADKGLDVISGCAGTILSLSTIYQATKNPLILNKLVACGQHLLIHRFSTDNVQKAWRIPRQNKPLTGFSHGTAGITYALLRLYEVTHDRSYLEAAKEGIAYESSVFSKSASNWPDFRVNSSSEFMVSWCHGAPGIGLARLGGLSILSTEQIEQDIELALQTTRRQSLQEVDHLCCGNMGRCETLMVGAQKLSKNYLQEAAKILASSVVERARQTGAYQSFSNLTNPVYNPTFFYGTAGIGYQLLRLAYPEILPSVLLWE